MSLRITWMPSPPTGRVSRGGATAGAGEASVETVGRSEPSRDLRPGPGAVVVPRILAPRPCVWRRAAGAYNGGLFRAPDGHGQAVSFALGSGPRPRRPRRRVGLGGLSAAFGRGRPE